MKIACPSCSAKYSIADEKVHNRLAKIRCRKCSTTIVIDGKANPPTVQAAGSKHSQVAAVSHMPASSHLPGSGSVFTVDVAEDDQRQMNVAQIVEAYNTGAITADTYVWQDGMADWSALADVPEINDALHSAARAASAPPPPHHEAPAVVPNFSPSTRPAAQEPVRAATRADARADLFGGIERAGGDHDAGAGRDVAANVTTANTGARNESSVLFSLSALTASETPAQPSSTASPIRRASTTEDSGLIDLAALAAAAESGDPAQSVELGSAPLGAAPLGFGAAPLSGGTTSPLGMEPARQQGSNKTGLFIGGGIAFAALVAGLVVILKEEPPAPPPVAAPPTTIVVTATAAPPPAPTPEPSATAAAEDADPKATDKSRYSKKPRSTKPGTKPSTDTSPSKPAEPATDKPAAPPKPKSNCKCAPDDLMCAMRCSAKG